MLGFGRKKNEPEEIAGAIWSETELQTRTRVLRIFIIGSIVFVIFLFFLSFSELFVQSLELPPLGGIVMHTIRAPYDFAFLDASDKTNKNSAKTTSVLTVAINQKVIDGILKNIDDFMTALEKVDVNSSSDYDLMIQILGLTTTDAEALRVVRRSKNYKNLRADFHSWLAPLLQKGIMESETGKLTGTIEIFDPLEKKSNILPAEAILTLEQVHDKLFEFVNAISPNDKKMLQFFDSLLSMMLQPTLILKLQSNQPEPANYDIKAIFVPRGEVIAVAGEEVTEKQLEMVAACSKQRHYHIALFGIANFILFEFLMLVFIFYNERFNAHLLDSQQKYLILVLIVVIVLAIAKPLMLFTSFSPYIIPIGFIPFLTVHLVNKKVAFFSVAIVSVMLTFTTSFSLPLLLYFIFSGTIALYICLRFETYYQLLLSSLGLGFSNILFLACLMVIGNQEYVAKRFSSMAFDAFLGGLVWISAILVLPVFERIFHITTDFRLAEFNDLNHPLLKQLLDKAPGSYHHSVATGNLAGIAADSVDANVLLARVGGYFHDIGKLHKPEFFMENSIGETNPHAKLSPLRSINIIKEHVKNGGEIARKYSLPEAIVNIIEEHHGTTMMESFYYKTMKDDLNKEIPPEFFRYAANKPRTIEAAIVMIADSVEAISRVVSNLDEQTTENIIKEVIKNKFQDGQFELVPLTTRDIVNITAALSQALMGQGHRRKKYPDLVRRAK